MVRHGLRMTEAQLEVVREAARGGYPNEVCGILVGRANGAEGVVVRVVPTANAVAGDRTRRYEIPPADLVHEQRSARESGLRILGFYHSHPDHPARPSDHDLDLAWPEYVYVIVPVSRGRAGQPCAWRLADDRTTFAEVALVVPNERTRWA